MRCFYVLKKWSSAKLSLNRDLSLKKMSLNRDCTVLQTLNEVYFIHDSISKGLDEIKEFTALEETTGRPYNQVLLNMYSGGDPLGFGIGKNL